VSKKEKPRDLYRVLGVKKTATDAEIKKAYRKKSMQFHPDRNPGDEKADAAYKEVQAAWEVLNDPRRKKMYDETGEVGEAVPAYDPEVMDLLVKAFTQTISEMMEEGSDLEKTDLLARLRACLRVRERELVERRGNVEEGLVEMRKAAGRFVDKEGNKDNLLNDIIRAKIERQERGVKELTEDLDLVKKTLDTVTGFVYLYDRDVTGMYYKPGNIILTYKAIGYFKPGGM
jgi:curved DNA-binding protein CbpA